MSEHRPEDCLAGGGELGALMRATDWSKTPLGAVAGWPQSLRTSVSIMLSSGFAVVVAWGPEFIFLYNDRYRPVLGATKHPMALGNRACDIFPEVWDFIGPLFRKTREGETVALDDVLIPLDRNGYLEECFFTLSYSPIRDETGGVGGMLAIVAETTERVQGERRLRTLRDLASVAARAQSSEEACRNAADVLAENPTDVPFALLYLVEGATTRLVAQTGQAGDPDASVWPLADAERSSRRVIVRDVATRLGTVTVGTYPEPTHTALVLPLTRPNVEQPYGYLVAGVSPRRALDDKYEGFLELCAEHVATAMSNALSHEAKRRRAEELAEIDRAKTAFFSNVSHEFRTPLTLMIAPLEDLASRPDAPPEAAIIHRNSLRLLKLVNTLLDFSRIEAGRVQAVYEPVDLATLTRDIASSFRAATERASLELCIVCQPLGQPVFVDRDMWEKIVLNLVSNAFKFTFEGSIRVELRSSGDHVELDVTDTGTGIPDHELPRVFERFHRVEGARSRSYEGSGIGLSLVQELVRMHGGSARVASREGAGTTFTVSVPFGRDHLPAERIHGHRAVTSTALGAAPYVEEALRWLPDAPPRLASNAATRPSASVVVADDNADMREYLAKILSSCGAVQTFPDGVSALEAIRRTQPDVVVTDIMMPRLDGFGLLRTLREDTVTQSIPVVMLSARAGEEARIEGAAAGADDYVVKPFSARELVARVQAKIDVSRERKRVALERANLRQIFAAVPAGIAILRGPEHVYEIANDTYCRIVGRGAGDLLGKVGRDALPELVEQGIWDIFDRIWRTGEPYVGSGFPATIARGPAGVREEAFFNWIGQPMRDQAGGMESILIFAVEVTEQVVARQHAEHLAAELERASRVKDDFLAMLGHELRNPLGPISMATQLLRRQHQSGNDRELAVIERQVHHLERLIEDLLDVSRITRGKVTLRRERVDMASLVAKAVELASPLLEQNRHHLDVDVPAGLFVYGDAVRLAQVVSNILMNAAKYTPPGGHIEVHGELADGFVIVRVRDDGVGIAPAMLPRVFDLFSQERQSIDRSRGGLGIGLAIVHSLVQMHGGRVEARSEGEGKGTEIEVRLPLAGSEAAHAAARAEQPPRQGVGRGVRVLIVDDNVDAADMLALVLESEGFTIRTMHDGEAALAAVADYRPDAVVLDIGLPVLDGFAIARRLRNLPETTHARIVAVTGYGQVEDRARTAAAGFDAHLTKPVDPDLLVSILAPPLPSSLGG